MVKVNIIKIFFFNFYLQTKAYSTVQKNVGDNVHEMIEIQNVPFDELPNSSENTDSRLLRTPGPVPFGTCICSNVETIFS